MTIVSMVLEEPYGSGKPGQNMLRWINPATHNETKNVIVPVFNVQPCLKTDS